VTGDEAAPPKAATRNFTGTPGRHSMKVRGAASKERIEALRVRKPGTWTVASAAAACDRRLGRGSAFHVLAMLGKYYNMKTGLCVPALGRIAAHFGISRRAVQQHINTIIDSGYAIAVPRRRKDGGWTSNAYILLFPEMKGDEAAPPDEQAAGGTIPSGEGGKAPSDPVNAKSDYAKPDFAYPSADPATSTRIPPETEGGMRSNTSQGCERVLRNPCEAGLRNRNGLSERPIERPSAEAERAHAREAAAAAQEVSCQSETSGQGPRPAEKSQEARQVVPAPRARDTAPPAPPQDPVGNVVRRVAKLTGQHEGVLWGTAVQWHGDLQAAGFSDEEAQFVIGEEGAVALKHGSELGGELVRILGDCIQVRIDRRKR
jgi:hypothetical protein